MTNSQDSPKELIMGRADVLFRFLQLIGADRPTAVDEYLNELDVTKEERPIVDQIVDLMVAGNKDHYEKYEQARREVSARDPYGAKEYSEERTYESALASFLTKWVEFENEVRTIATQMLGNDRGPLFSLLLKLQLLAGSDMQTIQDIRKLRNDVVHGAKTPKETDLLEGGKQIERLVTSLRDNFRKARVRLLQEEPFN